MDKIAQMYLDKIISIHNPPSDILKLLKNVLHFLISYHAPKKLKHLSFKRVKDISKCNELGYDINKLKVAISILTDERIEILVERFEFHDNDDSIVLSFDEMMNYIIGDTYISPITEEEVSKEIFSEIMTVYFAVSDSFYREVSRV